MSPISCPFCEELSTPGAKFCSACGGALYLAPCPRCGAVNDVSAATCYQCRGELSGRNTGALAVVVPASNTSKRRRYGFPQVSITVAILAAIGALAYYGLALRLPVDALPPPVTAAGESDDRAVPANAGVIRQDVTTTGTPTHNVDAGARPMTEPPASSPPEPTKKFRAAASPSRADPRSGESPRTRPVSAATSGPQASTTVKVLDPGAPSPLACTEAVAALGFCPPESAQVKRAAPPAHETARGEACTEAVAALGLCAPVSTQRKE